MRERESAKGKAIKSVIQEFLLDFLAAVRE